MISLGLIVWSFLRLVFYFPILNMTQTSHHLSICKYISSFFYHSISSSTNYLLSNVTICKKFKSTSLYAKISNFLWQPCLIENEDYQADGLDCAIIVSKIPYKIITVCSLHVWFWFRFLALTQS